MRPCAANDDHEWVVVWVTPIKDAQARGKAVPTSARRGRAMRLRRALRNVGRARTRSAEPRAHTRKAQQHAALHGGGRRYAVDDARLGGPGEAHGGS
eukprot:2289964-Pleurochrysis_carterae.AAC.1